MSGRRLTLALIVQGGPYRNRAARADIDFALAAAAMEFELHLYFSGAAIMQLAAERESAGAQLPPGYRAWAALPELGEVTAYGEQSWLAYCDEMGAELLLPAAALSAEQMKVHWRRHDRVMVI